MKKLMFLTVVLTSLVLASCGTSTTEGTEITATDSTATGASGNTGAVKSDSVTVTVDTSKK